MGSGLSQHFCCYDLHAVLVAVATSFRFSILILTCSNDLLDFKVLACRAKNILWGVSCK